MSPLGQAQLERIYAHAEVAYPKECCGFVFADGTVHAGRNIQDELHQSSPQLYARSSANGYTFSVADTLLLARALPSSNPVTVIYHSHPDVGAYFSREDHDKALYAGHPIHPVSYLVVDVQAAVARGAKLFEWDGTQFACRQTFAESRPVSSQLQGSAT